MENDFIIHLSIRPRFHGGGIDYRKNDIYPTSRKPHPIIEFKLILWYHLGASIALTELFFWYNTDYSSPCMFLIDLFMHSLPQ